MNEQMDKLLGIAGILIVLGGVGIGIYILVKNIKKEAKKVVSKTKEVLSKTKEVLSKAEKDLIPSFLNVDVELLSDSINIRNKENFKLRRLELKLNRRGAVSSFKYTLDLLKPQQESKILLSEFTDERGYRLDKEKVKVCNLMINYSKDAKGWATFYKEF